MDVPWVHPPHLSQKILNGKKLGKKALSIYLGFSDISTKRRSNNLLAKSIEKVGLTSANAGGLKLF